MRELRGELHLSLEAREVFGPGQAIGVEQLHGGGPAQHGVLRAEHLAHAAFAELLEKRVLSKLLRLAHLAPQPEDHARGDADEHEADGAPREDLELRGSQQRPHREGATRKMVSSGARTAIVRTRSGHTCV